MIPRNASPVEHRPPLKRIDLNPKRAASQPVIDIDCIGKFIEQDRIWKLLKQSAEGCTGISPQEADCSETVA